MAREPKAPVKVGRRLVLVAVLVIALASLATCGLVKSCKEPQAASSADQLFRGSDAAPAKQSAQAPVASTPSKAGAERPAAATPSVVQGGAGAGRRVVAIAFQLRAVPGAPGGVDRQLIDALKTDEAPATFFMAGLWAKAHPDVAGELAKMSHIEIGNGGYSAEYLRALPSDVIRERTQLAQQTIRSAAGVTPKVYRAAQAVYDQKSISAIAGLGLRPIAGDVDLTALGAGKSPVTISEQALARVKPGSIIVLTGDGADSRVEGIFVRLLGGLKRKGFELVTVSEIVK